MSPGLAKRINTTSMSEYTESSSPISNQTSPGISTNSSTASTYSSNSANLKIQFALEKNMQKLNLASTKVKNLHLTKEDIELFTNNQNNMVNMSKSLPNRNSVEREMTPDSIDENFYVNTNSKSKKNKNQYIKPNANKNQRNNKSINLSPLNTMNNVVSASSTSSSISSSLSSPNANQQMSNKSTNDNKFKKNPLTTIQQTTNTSAQYFKSKAKPSHQSFNIRHKAKAINIKARQKKISENIKISKPKKLLIPNNHFHQNQYCDKFYEHFNQNETKQEKNYDEIRDDDDDDDQDEDDDDENEENIQNDLYSKATSDNFDQEDEQFEVYSENDDEYEDCDQDELEYNNFKINSKTKPKIVLKPKAVKSYTQSDFKYNKKPNIEQNKFCKQNASAFVQPKNSLNISCSSSTSTLQSNQDSNQICNASTSNLNKQKLVNTNSSDRDFDTDEETNKLLEKQINNNDENEFQQCKNYVRKFLSSMRAITCFIFIFFRLNKSKKVVKVSIFKFYYFLNFLYIFIHF